MTDTPNRRYLTALPLPVLIFSFLVAGTWIWSIMPLVGLILTEQSIAPWKIGILGSVPWVVSLISTPLTPWFLRFISPISLLRLSTWIMLASATLFAMTTNAWLWVIAYILCGFSIATFSVLVDSFMATLPPPAQREKWFLAHMWTVNLTIIFGPLAIVYFGTDPIIFKIGLAFIAIVVVLCHTITISNHHMGNNTNDSNNALKDLLHTLHRNPVPLIISAVTGMAEGIAAKILPIQSYNLGFSEQISAFVVSIFGGGTLAAMLILGIVTQRVHTDKLIIPPLTALAITGLLIPLASASWLLYCLSIFCVGGLAGGIYAIACLDATKDLSPKQAVQIMAGIAMAYTLGSVIASTLAGTATSISLLWGMPTVIALSAIIALIATITLKNKTTKRTD